MNTCTCIYGMYNWQVIFSDLYTHFHRLSNKQTTILCHVELINENSKKAYRVEIKGN